MPNKLKAEDALTAHKYFDLPNNIYDLIALIEGHDNKNQYSSVNQRYAVQYVMYVIVRISLKVILVLLTFVSSVVHTMMLQLKNNTNLEKFLVIVKPLKIKIKLVLTK